MFFKYADFLLFCSDCNYVSIYNSCNINSEELAELLVERKRGLVRNMDFRDIYMQMIVVVDVV